MKFFGNAPVRPFAVAAFEKGQVVLAQYTLFQRKTRSLVTEWLVEWHPAQGEPKAEHWSALERKVGWERFKAACARMRSV